MRKLPVSTPDFDIEHGRAVPRPPLPGPKDAWAFFLDVDGTLLDIAPTPESVAPRADTVELLERLAHAAGGAVALVSGRPIRQLDELFTPLTLAAAGLHGLEWRSADGTMHPADGVVPDLTGTVEQLEKFARKHPGIRIEDKGMTVALHYRQAPDAAPDARRCVDKAARALGDRVHVQEGKMVLEIKSIDAHKGMVVERFLAELPFAGRAPVFIGDDVTDEDAFAVVNRHGGYSIRVGTERTRPSAARWALATPSQVHSWLGRVTDCLEQKEQR
ncbi:MAG TPA: trehalose-phosphatase [Gemmatimonadales bacterium]|nr:trehalose-phosphatase [Gemmatimonadales bacterium]